MSTLIEILNNGIPAGIIGGVVSAEITSLIAKIKDAFKGKKIDEKMISHIVIENTEIKETLALLQNKLVINKIISNQINFEGNNNFNIKAKGNLDKDIGTSQTNTKGDNNQTFEF